MSKMTLEFAKLAVLQTVYRATKKAQVLAEYAQILLLILKIMYVSVQIAWCLIQVDFVEISLWAVKRQ